MSVLELKMILSARSCTLSSLRHEKLYRSAKLCGSMLNLGLLQLNISGA